MCVYRKTIKYVIISIIKLFDYLASSNRTSNAAEIELKSNFELFFQTIFELYSNLKKKD